MWTEQDRVGRKGKPCCPYSGGTNWLSKDLLSCPRVSQGAEIYQIIIQAKLLYWFFIANIPLAKIWLIYLIYSFLHFLTNLFFDSQTYRWLSLHVRKFTEYTDAPLTIKCTSYLLRAMYSSLMIAWVNEVFKNVEYISFKFYVKLNQGKINLQIKFHSRLRKKSLKDKWRHLYKEASNSFCPWKTTFCGQN